MAKSLRRVYNKEFKEEAVKLADSSNKSTTEVARDLGINESLIRKWRNKLKDHGEKSFPGQGNRQQGSEVEEELRRIKLELENVKMERDILKKAMAIFSKNQN